MTRTWSMITLGTDRQYAGNRGYEDELRRVYRYDSNVANSRNVSRGDLALIRNRSHLLGIARIERIAEKPAVKTMLRCPVCKTVDLKQRTRKAPLFRCGNGHEFDRPIEESTSVTEFAAHYESAYVDAPDGVPVSEIKAAAPRPSDQLSIEEVDLARLERRLVSSFPATRAIIARYLQSESLAAEEAADGDSTAGSAGSSGNAPYTPSMADTRESILRAIKARRGQRRFRNALIRRHGGHCLITGCQLIDVVEAAHIWPYRGNEDNHPDNGLLLRADLHTLFDMDLVGIHPTSLEVKVSPAVRKFAPDYAALDGHKLRVQAKTRPAAEPLSLRWAAFEEKLSNLPPQPGL